jgi:hypothetical protein
MRIAVADLRSNPFRNLKNYPIDQSKVDALTQSIKDTEFWDNLLARRGDNGAYELAYGVHRLQALKKSGTDEVDIPVRKLDDSTMVKIMAHENQVEWGSSSLIEQETIRTIVKAFGEGKIELPEAKHRDGTGGGAVRTAPSFVVGLNPERSGLSYTAGSISKFLGGEKAGWPDRKIETILATLAIVEKGLIEEGDLEGLSTGQAGEVAKQTRRVEKETQDPNLAKAIGKRLAHGMRSATGRPGRGSPPKGRKQAITYHGAKRAADEMMGSHRRKTKAKPPKDIAVFADDVAHQLLELPTERMKAKLEALIKFREDMRAQDRRLVVGALRGLAKRVEKYADRLEV